MTRRCAYHVLGLVLTAAISARAAEPVSSLNPLRLIDKGDLKAFVEAPLFNPMRRLPAVVAPLAVPITTPTDTAEPPPNVHLLGIVQGASDVALVRGPDNKTVMLASGDHVSGWDVIVRPPNGLRLYKGRRVFDYAIFAATGPSAGPLAAPAPPAAAVLDGTNR